MENEQADIFIKVSMLINEVTIVEVINLNTVFRTRIINRGRH